MTDTFKIIFGLVTPFAGTALGAATVFFLRGGIDPVVRKAMLGFASGVMIAASVWSLIIPSIEMAKSMSVPAWLPATVGFLSGIALLLLIDKVTPHIYSDAPESCAGASCRTSMLFLAVTIHNIPEGMAVGVAFAGVVAGASGEAGSAVTLAEAMVLSLGIAIQNLPEGSIISVPMHAKGISKGKAFAYGTLSGAVEPLGAAITVALASVVSPALPYILSFAAGAMLYVVVEELIPEMSAGEHSNIGVVMFALGFTMMMALDTALG